MSELAFELKLKAPACSVSIGAADFCSLAAARPRTDRIPKCQSSIEPLRSGLPSPRSALSFLRLWLAKTSIRFEISRIFRRRGVKVI